MEFLNGPSQKSASDQTLRFIAVAATPLGALLGGALGEAIGLRATVALVAVGGIALATVAMLYSPLKPLKEMPEPGMPLQQER